MNAGLCSILYSNSWRRLVVLLMLFLSSGIAMAERHTNRGVGFYFDQDLLLPYVNEDRDYTMGLAMEFFWAKEDGIYPLDGLVGEIGHWMGLGRRDDNVVTSFILGSVNFTPDDLSNPQPILTERPYASLLYLGNKRVRAGKTGAVAAEALIGILGSDVAAKTQNTLHGWYRSLANSSEPVDPQGWDNQISDGGELTTRLRFSNSRLRAESSGRWDIATTWAVSLGYQTNVSLGVSARLGQLGSSFWSIPFDPVNRGSFLPSLSSDEWYFWTAYRIRLVAYDALLQGQFRESRVKFSSSEIEQIVHEGAVGATISLGKTQFTFAMNAKSAELEQAPRRRHFWGSFNIIHHF